jgi:hypothetical protein
VAEKDGVKRTLIKVSIKDGVLEDNFGKHMHMVYDGRVYDNNMNRKKEFYGLHVNFPK